MTFKAKVAVCPVNVTVEGLQLSAFSLYTCIYVRRSQWPRSLRRRLAAARLLKLWVRIPPGLWMFVVSVVMYRSLRRADHSSRGVLPTAVSRCA